MAEKKTPGQSGKKRIKAGTSKAAAAARKVDFANAYIKNGKNGTQAAIEAGFSPNGADVASVRLLGDASVRAIIAEATEKAAKLAGLSVERTLREVARLAYSDPRKLYGKDGNFIPIPELDDDTAATVASIEHLEEFSGRGESRELIGYTKKLKVWDKNAALEKAMKYHGLYKADNAQLAPVLPPILNIISVPAR